LGCIFYSRGKKLSGGVILDGHELSEQKRGYLKGDFALFHLKDMKDMQFEYHYHDFNKIIIFISGSVTYLIEGKAYRLRPWDVLFVSSSEVHKPVIDPTSYYERVVIWVNPGFLQKHSYETDLNTCFCLARERKNNLLRPDPDSANEIMRLVHSLEEACKSSGFGSTILRNSVFIQLLVVLTRKLMGIGTVGFISDIIADESVQRILDYINSNITGDLSVEELASRFFLSKYHLMRKFKKYTGYSVHSYVLQKRLLRADTLIRQGVPATQACEQSGFNDYSNFLRAYKRMFGESPKKRAAAATGKEITEYHI